MKDILEKAWQEMANGWKALLRLAVLVCVLIPLACGPAPGSGASDQERALQAAQKLYANLKNNGVDFSTGPCISQQILPDWCVDIAHFPRQPADDLPKNQCPTYLDGRVHHLVELDPAGNLIRAQ